MVSLDYYFPIVISCNSGRILGRIRQFLTKEVASPWWMHRFDTVIKVDVFTGQVVNTWYQEGVYVTEADFVAREDGVLGEEDEGVLLSVTYDSTSDSSSLLILDALDLKQLASLPLAGDAVAFHAHGKFHQWSCEDGLGWFQPRRLCLLSPPSFLRYNRHCLQPDQMLCKSVTNSS